MKTNVIAGLGLALTLGLAGIAAAGTPNYDALTMRETRRLAAGQVHLNRVENRAKADGVVTKRERAHLQHEANQQSRRIHRQKHDAQDRN
jgi:hypothetical protein